MNDRPFPKPPPAEPLPLDEWILLTDRAEVGRQSFFRGRDQDYEVFRNAVNSLAAGHVGGGTMVFQGAPGAGKSALMLECMEAVRCHSKPEAPWIAVSLPPNSLQSAIEVITAIAEAARLESERLRRMHPEKFRSLLGGMVEQGARLFRELSERGAGAFGFTVGGTREDSALAGSVFRNAAPLLENFHVAVCVDEAQNTPALNNTLGVLDCLHRDTQGIPLVTAFFGLSDTQQVLRQCGLSRFARGRTVNLEPLSQGDAATAIRDVFLAYGFDGSTEEKARWIDRLAELTQGWPQHIHCVAAAACQVLRENGGRIKPALFCKVREAALASKEEYYLGRLEAGSPHGAGLYKRIALAAAKNGQGILSKSELDQLTTDELTGTEQHIEEFLTQALHAGLLAPAKNLPGYYRIPIPSLADYLCNLPIEL